MEKNGSMITTIVLGMSKTKVSGDSVDVGEVGSGLANCHCEQVTPL